MFSVPLYLLLQFLYFFRVSAFPTVSQSEVISGDVSKRAVPVWKYYADAPAAFHQSQFNLLSGQGYRMISLSSYGPSTAVRYAAIWVQRGGPAYTATHGVTAQTYQTWFDQSTAQGYVPILVTATGPRASAVFSGVMEKISVSSWTQRCDMTANDFTNNNQIARNNRQILKSFREYGATNDRRYCAIWHANPVYDKWSLNFSPMTSADYQTLFNSEVSKPYWRVGLVSVSEDLRYGAFFSDNMDGDWVARHDLTVAQLATVSDEQKTAGRYPIHITGGGSGTAARFAVIYGTQDSAAARTWRVTGNAVTGFKSNTAANTQTESLISTFMKGAGVRQVQLSIAKNGVPLLDRAYTWSEPTRRTTQITNPFLLASVSKAFLEAAIQSLYDSGKLTPTTRVYTRLGYSAASPGDARRFSITVQQLLDHQGGYNRTASGDPTYNMRNIALAQSNGARPATLKDVVDYMFARPLDFAPGSAYEYSNYGYLLLSHLVEVVTAQPYYNYLQTTILSPEGLTAKQWLTNTASHNADNVIQESQYTGLSALQPTLNTAVAFVYGGDGMYKESAVGPASLAANAQSLTKFIQKHAVWGNGGRRPGYRRDGSTPGARTWIESRTDGIDWALTINTRDFPNGDTDFNNIVNNINNWLATNPTL